MSHYHACVWIDHREAKIFGIGIDEADEATTPNAHATHHIHRKADHVGLGKAPLDHAFLKEIAEKLEPAQAILLTGPGQAKTELADYLKQHFPAIAARVWGIERSTIPLTANSSPPPASISAPPTACTPEVRGRTDWRLCHCCRSTGL